MSISLYEHNEKAYYSAVEMLFEQGRAAVIHPTGTGKSFIGFKLCEDNPDKKVCWLSPSEYIFRTQLENLISAADGYVPQNVEFFTYTKLMIMSDSEIADICPDYIILDEFHRCGADMWGKGVAKLLGTFPNVPVLGLSATAIRYLDNRRDMADELFDGNVASEMTLGEAIVRGILNPPKYVLSVYSYQKDLERYEARVRNAKSKAVRDAASEYLEALRRSLEKADKLDDLFDKNMDDRHGKYLVFASNVAHMNEMIGKAEEWFCKVDTEPHIYSVYSDDPSANQEFIKFKKDNSAHLRLLYCIDALNEGIHLDDISGVILLRPTVSPIIYKQQIGRALSASKAKTPVIFDIVNNIENLYSIGAIEEEMREAVVYYRAHGDSSIIINENFEIIDRLADCRKLFEGLEGTLTASWDLMFEEAKKYAAENGDLEVPKRYITESGYSLGAWINTQRRVYAGKISGILTEEQAEKLTSIGMRWESKDRSWGRYFEAAKKYYAEHGDLLAGTTYETEDGVGLGRWLVQLRMCRKSGISSQYLTEEHIQELDSIGMVWDVFDYLWEQNFYAAAEYHRVHGNLKVPADYVNEDGIRLGAWLYSIRNSRGNENSKRAQLTEEQIARLDSIDMIWDKQVKVSWEQAYNALCRYVKQNGNADVPSGYIDENGIQLGKWVMRQRGSKKLNAERRAKLEKLGMNWEITDPWESKFRLAEDYYREHGDLKVPGNYVVDGVWLGRWLSEQKNAGEGKRKRQLTDEQKRKLESVGMVFGKTASDEAWELQFANAKAYFEEHGNLNVSKDYVAADGRRLGVWIIAQKNFYRQGKLSAERISRLSSVGLKFTASPWEVGISHAKEYVRRYGVLNAKNDYVCEDGYRLGSWLRNQRSAYKSGKLAKSKVQQLEALGMVWAKYIKRYNHSSAEIRVSE